MSGDDLEDLDTPGEQPPGSLRGRLLLASVSLEDVNFARAIVLILRHDAEGALGVVLNRPLGLTVEEACAAEVEAAKGVRVPLFMGGPLAGPMVAVHGIASLAKPPEKQSADAEGEGSGEGDDEPWAELIMPEVWLTAHRQALEGLMRFVRRIGGAVQENPTSPPGGDSPEPMPGEVEAKAGGGASPAAGVKFLTGYASWGSGQLEGELAEGAWQIVEPSPRDIYAGGSPGFPAPPPSMSLPPGAVGLLGLLSHSIESEHDLNASLAAGIRQWVRLSTRANLSRMLDPARIPEEPWVN